MPATPVAIRLGESLKEQRESFRQEALDVWREYQETGLHVAGDEADTWLAELEAGNDIEPPKCHE